MKAFHDDKKIQEKYLLRLEEHYKLDEIIKGQYWEDGKGCAVGCLLHSDNHSRFPIELGWPEWLGRLIDTLFEGVPNDKSKEFPLKLYRSIPLGFDNWQHIYHQLCVFMLEKICKNTDNEIVVKAICDVITLHKTESKDESAWSATRSAARSAESAAWSADESAARSAARSAAWSADESAARSAESAARSAARSAAWSADESADESAARSAAWSADESAAYYDISEKLIDLFYKSSK